MTGHDTRVLSAIERVAVACAWIPPAIGIFVLAGYTFNVTDMTRLFMNAPFMTSNAAVLITLLGFGLLLRLDSYRSGPRFVASSVLIGLAGFGASAVLLQYIFRVDLGIDLLLWPSMSKELFAELGAIHPGRFAITTAISLTCLSVAALGIDARTMRERRVSLALALASTTICGFMLTAYLFQAQVPQHLIRDFSIMAPPTALALLLLGISVLFARPGAGDVGLLASQTLGGVLLWRLLPVALLLPLVLGWFNVMQVRLNHFEPGYGTAMMATILSAVFIMIVWLTAYHLDRLDSAAKDQAGALRESEERYRNILDTANEGIWILDLGAKTSYVNKRMQGMLGYTATEMSGRPLYDFVAPGFRPEVESHFASRVQGAVESYDFQFQCQDGST
ncbi:MAG: PAS domain S-box protein, partial [bacterium]|nr:PAS domain S-box protein [bacterium]